MAGMLDAVDHSKNIIEQLEIVDLNKFMVRDFNLNLASGTIASIKLEILLTTNQVKQIGQILQNDN